ncbi:MAG: response regulator transcription factor [Enterococcus sp.]
MLRLSIFEPDSGCRASVECILNNYLYIMDLDASIECSAAHFNQLFCLSENESCDRLFLIALDEQTKEETLMQTVKLRKKYPYAKFVFLTRLAEAEHLSFVYRIEALAVIKKGDFFSMREEMVEILNLMIERTALSVPMKEDAYLFIKSNGVAMKLAIQDILFFETTEIQHKIRVHLTNRSIDFYCKMKTLVEKNSAFFRCHHSYIVNIFRIERVDPKRKKIVLDNGDHIFVSSRKYKGLIENLMQNMTLDI